MSSVAIKARESKVLAGTHIEVRVSRMTIPVEGLEDLGPLGHDDGRHVLSVRSLDPRYQGQTFLVSIEHT